LIVYLLHAEFVAKVDWIQKDQNDELYTCASAAIKNMIHIADKVPAQEQIPQACCTYWLVRDCLTGKLKTLTSEPKRIFLEKMTDDAMTNLIEFLCTKQNSVDTCNKLMPNDMKRMTQTFKDVKKSDVNVKQSYLIPFLDVVSEK
jgi:hypothetical protein